MRFAKNDKLMNEDPVILNKRSRLCSDHFGSAYIVTNSVRKTLLPYAVPTLYQGRPLDISPQAEADDVVHSPKEKQQTCLSPFSPKMLRTEKVKTYSRSRSESILETPEISLQLDKPSK